MLRFHKITFAEQQTVETLTSFFARLSIINLGTALFSLVDDLNKKVVRE